MDKDFSSEYIETNGCDKSSMKIIKIGGEKYRLQFFDVGGFNDSWVPSESGRKGIIFVFDITNNNSFNSFINWIDYLKEDEMKKASKILIGNKIDLEDERELDITYVKNIAKEKGVKLIYTSAKNNTNVYEALKLITEEIIEEKKKDEEELKKQKQPLIIEEKEKINDKKIVEEKLKNEEEEEEDEEEEEEEEEGDEVEDKNKDKKKAKKNQINQNNFQKKDNNITDVTNQKNEELKKEKEKEEKKSNKIEQPNIRSKKDTNTPDVIQQKKEIAKTEKYEEQLNKNISSTDDDFGELLKLNEELKEAQKKENKNKKSSIFLKEKKKDFDGEKSNCCHYCGI